MVYGRTIDYENQEKVAFGAKRQNTPAHPRGPPGPREWAPPQKEQKHNEVRGDCVCASVLFPYRIVREREKTFHEKQYLVVSH